MPKYGNLIKHAGTALLFIALEVAALLMLNNSDIIHRQWIMRGVITLQASVWGGTESIKHYFSLKSLNDSLAEVNNALYDELTQAKLLLMERGMDTVLQRSTFEFIPATIVKGSTNRQHNYLILNKGKRDGITPQMGVITQCGVVGIIEAVTPGYSYVISFLSPNVNISCRIGHNGAIGRLMWDGKGSKSAVLSEIPLHVEAAPGDTVYTSGFSNLYPSDIPLGTIASSSMKDGASLDLEIDLFQEFKSLKYVSVVRNLDSGEIDSLTRMHDEKYGR